MKITRKKKAFTLTELLVVVIIIGFLSAVVLPKFNKIIETRKTTEAEELMAAIRTEQEKRCAFDKDYLTDAGKLTDILPSTETKNFEYSFTSTGMVADSKGKYKYQLQMPSYEDGRICCANQTECLKLNKDYPLCSELIARADYQNSGACVEAMKEGEGTLHDEPPVMECSGSDMQRCGCNDSGRQTRVCDKSTGEWGDWSECDAAPCSTTEPEEPKNCEEDFQVNDTCCDWIWTNRSGKMDSSEFKSCWRERISTFYFLKEGYAYGTNSSSSCVNKPSLNCVNPTISSGKVENTATNCTPCTFSVDSNFVYLTKEEAEKKAGYPLAGCYWKTMQRQCNTGTDCSDSSHMDFPTPSSPKCYARVPKSS